MHRHNTQWATHPSGTHWYPDTAHSDAQTPHTVSHPPLYDTLMQTQHTVSHPFLQDTLMHWHNSSLQWHHMGIMAFQITGCSTVSTICSGVHQRKHQSSMLLVLCEVNPQVNNHKEPVTWKMFPGHDIIMQWAYLTPDHLPWSQHLWKKTNNGFWFTYLLYQHINCEK